MSPDLIIRNEVPSEKPSEAAVITYVYHHQVDGLTTELLDDNIIYTTLSIVNTDTLEAWGTHWRLLRNHWPSTQIMYSVGDFSGFDGSHLLYGIEKAKVAMQQSQSITAYIAVVVPRSSVGKLIEFAIRTTRMISRAEHFQLFTRRDDAIRWLRVCRTNEEHKQTNALNQ